MLCTLKVSTTSIWFPSLKILELEGVTFLNEHFSKSRQLQLSFPALEVFNARNCIRLNVKIVNMDAPVLKTMGYHKYVQINVDSHGCELKLCARSLTKFNFDGYQSEDIILLNPLSICDANAVLTDRQGYFIHTHETGLRLLQQISNVKHLSLSNITIELGDDVQRKRASLGLVSNYCFVMFYAKALAYVENLQAFLPTFDNMIHLRVSGWGNIVCRTFMDFLRSLPVLETLIIEKGMLHWVWDLFVQEMLPQYFLSNLKMVEYQNSYGDEHDLRLVKFLLENALVLAEMILAAADSLRRGPKKYMEKVKKRSRNSY